MLLDKTGTITVGNRQAIEFIAFEAYSEEDVGEAAFLSSWHDDTPEGRSILRLAYEKGFVPKELNSLATSEVNAFSAVTRTSGVKITHLASPYQKVTSREETECVFEEKPRLQQAKVRLICLNLKLT